MRGKFKGSEGRVTAVYRKKYVIHVERCTRAKNNKQEIPVGLNASNCMITKFKDMNRSRRTILERKGRKGTKSEVLDNLGGVD